MPAVSPEALGLAEHVGSIVADMNRNRGITAGGMQLLMLLSGARWKRRQALLQVSPLLCRVHKQDQPCRLMVRHQGGVRVDSAWQDSWQVL